MTEEILIVEQRLRVARMGDRAVAAILDQIALFPLFVAAIFGVAMQQNMNLSGTVELHGGPAMISMALIALAWLAYYTIAEALFGGTLGKQMMGIQVKSSLRQRASWKQIALRNLIRPIDAIGLYLLGFIVCISSTHNQRTGDFVAGTLVFETKTDRKFAVTMWILWMVVAIIGILLMERVADL